MSFSFIIISSMICGISAAPSGANSIKATEYRLFLEPDFQKLTYDAKAEIEVEVPEQIKEFKVKISKDLKIDGAFFYSAEFIFRGNPSFIGSPVETKYDAKTQTLTGTLLHAVPKEQTKEGAYIEISYKGTIGKKGSDAALIEEKKGVITANLKKGAFNLFPLFDDNNAKFDLRVTTNVEPKIKGSLVSVDTYKHFNEEKYTARVNSKGEKVKLNDVAFTITV